MAAIHLQWYRCGQGAFKGKQARPHVGAANQEGTVEVAISRSSIHRAVCQQDNVPADADAGPDE
jgi:hypothetical protein